MHKYPAVSDERARDVLKSSFRQHFTRFEPRLVVGLRSARAHQAGVVSWILATFCNLAPGGHPEKRCSELITSIATVICEPS